MNTILHPDTARATLWRDEELSGTERALLAVLRDLERQIAELRARVERVEGRRR